GLDVDGHYASGTLGVDQATLGGVAARAVGEARFAVGSRVALFVALAAGGHAARVRRMPPSAAAASSWDGGPALAVGVGVLARVGPGLVELAAGYAWAPLAGAGYDRNIDGVALTVGY